jgi:hypothetical protein
MQHSFITKIYTMKKRIILLSLSFLLIFSSSYAKNDHGKIPEAVTAQFSQDFSIAGNVKWEKIGFYYKASFVRQGIILFAFYTEDADYMGAANYILSNQLPASLASSIKKNYDGYWITDLFTYSNKDKSGYVVTLENADQEIMLKTDGNQHWYLYKSVKKS